MNEELLEHTVNRHEKEISNLTDKVIILQQNNSRIEVQMQNLCDNLRNLTSAIKWLIGLFGSSLVGFFFYAIQNNLF